MLKLDPTLPIVAIKIEGWKNDRWGEKVPVATTDAVYVHQNNHTISETIKRTMKMYELKQEDIINITAEAGDVGRDAGSSDFWMFVRNPNYYEPNLEDPKPFVEAGDAG